MKIYLVWYRESFDDYNVIKAFTTNEQALYYVISKSDGREDEEGHYYDDKANYYYITEVEVTE
jgi:hypothetical protein